jgi:outer membrane protein TolC
VLLLCFIISRVVKPEEPILLTLDICVDIAVKNNPKMKIAGFKLNSAKYKKLQMVGNKYFPSLNISGSYTRLSEVPTIEMPNILANPIKFGAEESIISKMSICQPVFTGGKLSLVTKRTKYDYEIAKQEYLKVKSELVFEVKKAFYAVLFAENSVEISSQVVEIMQDHYEVTKKLYEKGKVSSYDVSRAKVQFVDAQTQLLKSQNELIFAKKHLYLLLNCEGVEHYEITGELEFEVESEQKQLQSLDYYVRTALKNHPELVQVELNRKISETLVGLSVTENLPEVSLIGNYSYQKPYYFVDRWTSVWSGMIMLSFPFLDGFGISNYAKIKSAKLMLNRAELVLEQFKKKLELEIERTYSDLVESIKMIQLQEENVKTAKQNLEVAQQRYVRGLMSSLEVRDAQLTFFRTKLKYLQALYDYKVAKANLMKLSGLTQ